jgi:hypothetical protein
MDSKIDDFFDECLKNFNVNNLHGLDGKTDIDINLRYSHVEKTYLKMPEQTRGQDVAHHVFSVLSYFFDCRDDGAFRYRWEESLLDYFGASLSGEDQRSDFHKHNFRNAISAIHVKLFDHGSDIVGSRPR